MPEINAWGTPLSPPSNNDDVTVGLNSTNNTVGNFQTYVNPLLGFKIDYPSGWSYQQYDPPSNETIYPLVNIVPPLSEDPKYVTSLEIGTEELPNLVSLDRYARDSVAFYRTNYQNFSLNSVTIGDNPSNANLTLSGKPSYQIVFTDSLDGISRKNIEVATLDENDKRAYYLLFRIDNSKYDNLFPVVQRMIESFELDNSALQKSSNDTQVESKSGFESNSTNSSQSFLVYSNPQLGIRLDYPAYAEVQENHGIFDEVLFTTLVGYEFGIGVYPNQAQEITNQIIQDEIEGLREQYSQGFELLGSEATTLSGYPAHSITFRYIAENGASITSREIFSLVGELQYRFNISSLSETYNTDLPIFERIVDSMEITGKPENYSVDNILENEDYRAFEKYTNPFGYSVSYPAGSEITEYVNIGFFEIPNTGASKSNVSAMAFTIANMSKSLDQVLEEGISTYSKQAQNFELINSENLIFAGHPGGVIEYEFVENGEKKFSKDVFTIVDNTLYEIIFTTSSANIESATPIMNNMLDSFRIIQPSSVNNQVPLEGGLDSGDGSNGSNSSNDGDGDGIESGGFGQRDNNRALDPSQGISNLNFLSYRHPTLGFTIEYPDAPSLDVDELNAGVSFPHNKGTYHVLVMRNLDKSLDEFASELQEKPYSDYQFIDQRTTTIAGYPAIQSEYTYTDSDQGIPLHALEYYVLYGGDGYILSFNTAYPTDATLNDFRAVVQKMTDSFQFPQDDPNSSNDNQHREDDSRAGEFGGGNSGDGNDGGLRGFGQQDNGEGGFDPFG